MRLNWQDFPGAPAPGTVICALDDLPEGGVLSLMLGEYPVLVVGKFPGLRVYVNACPHQFLPLDQRSNSIVSADGMRLMCSNHQAEFSLLDGEGQGGLVAGCRLAQVPIAINRNFLRVEGAE